MDRAAKAVDLAGGEGTNEPLPAEVVCPRALELADGLRSVHGAALLTFRSILNLRALRHLLTLTRIPRKFPALAAMPEVDDVAVLDGVLLPFQPQRPVRLADRERAGLDQRLEGD